MKKEDIHVIEMTFVNAFLIKIKTGFVLIDTGIPQFWGKLESELTAAGCIPGNLQTVIITHGDIDHLGNCARLRNQYKCKITMHHADSLMAEEGLTIKRSVKTLKAKIFVFLRRLLRPKISFEHFKPDSYLVDGQRLTEYGLDASVVHIPGHTKGSIGIMTDDGLFFAGDTFTNRGIPDTATYIENAGELKSSLARLKGMSPKTIYPGHGKPFEWGEIEHKL